MYGYLGLRNKLGANGFSDRDEDMALTLATHAGFTYENAQLYDDLRHRSAALEEEVADRRRAEARTQLALTAAHMGVWELDLAADRLDWSDSLAAIFGLSPGQAPTTRDEFTAMIHPDDRVAAAEDIERAITERTDIVNEFRTIWPDRTVHWIAGRARVLSDEGGSPTRIIGVCMDIGERKSLEEQFRQAQKMEAVGQLAGGVAHDFNNLLTVIRGYAELLVTTLSADDDRRTDVDEIARAADRAAGLTRQLLTFSHKQVRQPTFLDVNSLVINTSRMLRRLIGADIELVTNLAPAPGVVHADVGEIEQILMNLAVNARDAMPQGGRLSIETAAVALDDAYAIQHAAVRPGPYVMLAVTDSGIGIDEQTKHRIFEPFFTTKERGRGTGLGLSVVFGIIQQNRGHIWVDSAPGRGTTFQIYLPRIDAAASPDRSRGRPMTLHGHETVLLVEDDDQVREVARLILRRHGYTVLAARNGDEAERVCEAHVPPIHLLFTDLVMPGITGRELAIRLRRLRPDLKVLCMSGYVDAVDGGDDITYLEKPFTAEALAMAVRRVLDSDAGAGPRQALAMSATSSPGSSGDP